MKKLLIITMLGLFTALTAPSFAQPTAADGADVTPPAWVSDAGAAPAGAESEADDAPAPAAVEATAAPPVQPEKQPTIESSVAALSNGHYLAGVMGIIFVLTGIGRLLFKPKGKTGKRILAAVATFITVAAAALHFGAPLSAGLFATALVAAWAASGANEDVKDLGLVPKGSEG